MATTHTLQLPKPHSHKQQIIMQSLVTPGLQEAFFCCGTKFGKSLSAAAAMLSRSYVKHNSLSRWVAPIHSQAKIGMKYHTRLGNHKLYDINKSDPSLTFKHNNSIIEFKSGKFPEDLEGEGVDGGYCFDEAAKMVRQVYDSAKTTLTVTRAPLIAFSTPRGKNWFYEKCMEIQAEMEWCLKNNIPPTKIFLTAPSFINPAVTQQAIDDMRKSLPDRLFRQYVLAEFVDDGSIFAGFRECFYTDRIEIIDEHALWTVPEAKKYHVVVGVDWAKTTDWTVFIAADVNTRRVIGFQRFQKKQYTESIKYLVKFCGLFGDTLCVRHDKTGVGQAIDDQLSYTKLPYEGVTFTNRSKTDMVNSTITAIETRTLWLPWWTTLDKELDAFEVKTNLIGTMIYGAPSGMHDDTVCALMLCVSALDEYSDKDMSVKYLDDLKADMKKTDLEKYYDDDDED